MEILRLFPNPLNDNQNICQNQNNKDEHYCCRCGALANFFSKYSNTWRCSENSSHCPVVKKKISEAFDRKGTYENLDQPTKDKMAWSRNKILTPLNEIFKENSHVSNEYIRKYIFQLNLIEYKCSNCGIIEWDNKPLVLTLDHKNGNNCDNRLENLRFLCPNCHSQTDTFCGKNINTGIIKISDEEILNAIKSSPNIRKTLIKVGLTPKGANYERIRNIMIKYNISF